MDSKKIALRRRFDREALVHLEPVLRVAACMIEDRGDADDLVQKTFVRGYRMFDQLETGGDYKPWLFSILTDLLVTDYGIQVHAGEAAEGEAQEDVYLYDELNRGEGAIRSEKDFFSQISANDVQAAVWQLPDDLRLTTALALLGKLSHRDISEVTGFPTGTVQSRLRRGRELLTRVLMDYALYHGGSGVIDVEAATERS